MSDGFKKNPVDERASPRRPIRCKVKLISSKGQTIHGESFDLSTGGIGVTLDLQLTIGEVYTVMFAPFTHGSVKSVNVTASVAYCMLNSAGFRTGFQFLNITPATTTVIASIIG